MSTIATVHITKIWSDMASLGAKHSGLGYIYCVDILDDQGRAACMSRYATREECVALVHRIAERQHSPIEIKDVTGHFSLASAPENLDTEAVESQKGMDERISRWIEKHD